MKTGSTFGKSNLIPLMDAANRTLNWQKKHIIKAILLHKNELSCITQILGVKKIQFYLGLNQSKIEVMVVGIDQFGEDIINETGENSHVYNISFPCPPISCPESELYHSLSETTDSQSVSDCSKRSSCADWLQEISFETAFKWTFNWQITYDLKSFLFGIDELEGALNTYGTSQVRIYFGLSTNSEISSIIVGVDDAGKDILGPELAMHQLSACGLNVSSGNRCDVQSPLYHNILK